MKSAIAGILCCATASLLGVSNASAVYVDWYGGGAITALANCPEGNFTSHVNSIIHARYLPPNLGTNGNVSSLSFLNQHWAQGYARTGAFTSTFQTVTSNTIARFNGPSGYPPPGVQVRITSQVPATITATTPVIQLQGQVRGFSGFPGNANCVATFSLILLKQ